MAPPRLPAEGSTSRVRRILGKFSSPIFPLLVALVLYPVIALYTSSTIDIKSYVLVLPASLVIAYSAFLAVRMPTTMATRLGLIGSMLASSLLLGVVGAGLGALACMELDAACRSSIGAWMLAWMLLVPVYALGKVTLHSAFRFSVFVARAPYRLLASLLGRPRRR